MTGNCQPELERQVLEFLAHQWRVPIATLTPHTSLVDDLGIGGDDAVELMEAYVERFSIDCQGFNFDDYFPCEGFDLIGIIISLFRPTKHLKPITVSMLIDSAHAGRWLDQKP